jgi:Tol biopolymer transport system component
MSTGSYVHSNERSLPCSCHASTGSVSDFWSDFAYDRGSANSGSAVSRRSSRSVHALRNNQARQIALSSSNGRYRDLYMIDLETEETRKLTTFIRDDLNSMWSL